LQEDEMEDWHEIDAGEASDEEEDLIALNAIEAMLEIDGDSEFEQESRAALAAISDSAMALKASRQARQRREALEQVVEREQHEVLARKEEEQADRRAQAERQERARLAQEAQHLARERERLRIEQELFEARRREENARKAAWKQVPAHNPARFPIETERPERVGRNEVPRRRFQGRGKAQRSIEQGRHAVPVRVDQEAARQRQRVHDEREWREAVRRDEEARKARRERNAALTASAPPIATRPPVNARKKSGKRHRAGGRRSEATSRRAERTAMPAVRSSRPAQAVPPSPPKRSSTSRPDLQRVVGDVRNAVASTTVDLAKRPRKAEPLVPRPVRSDTHTSLTGADLAIWRSRLDLTQQAAADRLGVRQGTISKAESKGRVKLGPTLLLALAAALAKEHRTA
jgi:DNA-binding XRE family transcriptional regulator